MVRRTLSLWIVALYGGLALAAPPGFVKTTIPLEGPPVGLAFDAAGVLWALEGAPFGSNRATMRAILADGTQGPSFSVTGDDPNNFFVGDMVYDSIGDRFLITDNTADGRLYVVDKWGNRTTLATNMAYLAGVAVRHTGEIFVTTADGFGAGTVLQIDRDNGAKSVVFTGLDYGADLTFDASGHLLVQDVSSVTFLGRIQRLPIVETPGGLQFGPAMPLAENLNASYGMALDSEQELFATGAGGLYRISESPPGETLFYTDGSIAPIATAIAFHAGAAPFEPFAGPYGGRMAINADFGYVKNDLFVTLLTPAIPGDYDGSGTVDAADYLVWKSAYGSPDATADGNRDGRVDAADYVVWRVHLAPSRSSVGAASVVPEPSVLQLSGFVMVASFFVLGRVRPVVFPFLGGTANG